MVSGRWSVVVVRWSLNIERFQICHCTITNDHRTTTTDHRPSIIFHLGRCLAQRGSMTRDSSKSDDLQRRLIQLAADIIAISAKLPTTRQGRHIGEQILRCGTAAAANYGEARGAESRTDFVHKLGIVLKELNETAIWLD